MLTNAEAAARVARGAAYLDATYPGWWARVDPDLLDLCSCVRCMLGQLTGGFWQSPIGRETPLDQRTAWTPETRAVALGFLCTQADADERASNTRVNYRVLTDAWLAAMADRLVSAPEQELAAQFETPEAAEAQA